MFFPCNFKGHLRFRAAKIAKVIFSFLFLLMVTKLPNDTRPRAHKSMSQTGLKLCQKNLHLMLLTPTTFQSYLPEIVDMIHFTTFKQ